MTFDYSGLEERKDPARLRVCGVGSEVETLLRDLAGQLVRMRASSVDHDLLLLAAQSLAHVVEYRELFTVVAKQAQLAALCRPVVIEASNGPGRRLVSQPVSYLGQPRAEAEPERTQGDAMADFFKRSAHER